jgi:hypothetical protein
MTPRDALTPYLSGATQAEALNGDAKTAGANGNGHAHVQRAGKDPAIKPGGRKIMNQTEGQTS